jgi:hypothetical protein
MISTAHGVLDLFRWTSQRYQLMPFVAELLFPASIEVHRYVVQSAVGRHMGAFGPYAASLLCRRPGIPPGSHRQFSARLHAITATGVADKAKELMGTRKPASSSTDASKLEAVPEAF